MRPSAPKRCPPAPRSPSRWRNGPKWRQDILHSLRMSRPFGGFGYCLWEKQYTSAHSFLPFQLLFSVRILTKCILYSSVLVSYPNVLTAVLQELNSPDGPTEPATNLRVTLQLIPFKYWNHNDSWGGWLFYAPLFDLSKYVDSIHDS